MSIYTDGVHLVSDSSLAELHAFAQRMGLKREWFQDKSPGTPGYHPHYDLTTKRAALRAEANGAQAVSPREVVKAMWRFREANPTLCTPPADMGVTVPTAGSGEGATDGR